MTLNNGNVFIYNFVLNHRWLLTDFEQVEKLLVILLIPNKLKLSSHFAVNSWAWLLLRYLIETFLLMLICQNLFLFMLIFLVWLF